MFANTQMGGVNFAFPDVCKTPPVAVPIPYPNTALGVMGVPPVAKVLFSCAPAHNMATTIPITLGDQPGVMLGLVSQTVMVQSRQTTAAFTVILCGLPATRLTSMSMQNMVNIPPGAKVAPSQVKVVLLAP
jgi:hypothetical protein